MPVTLDEMKQYLRVDYPEDDSLIEYLMSSAVQVCLDVLRTDDVSVLEADPNGKPAVLYTTAYMYEHRESADYHSLMITLRSLLGASRKADF